MSLEKVIQKTVHTIKFDESIKNAAKVMSQNHIGSVIVTKKTFPVGILTDRDIVMAIANNKHIDMDLSVEKIMTPNLILCSINDDIFETILKMKDNGIRRIPVINKQDMLVGIVSFENLLRFLSNELYPLANLIVDEVAKESHMKQKVNSFQQLSTSVSLQR